MCSSVMAAILTLSFTLAASDTAVLADGMLSYAALEDTEALRELAAGFNCLTSNTVVGCVGACSFILRSLSNAPSGAVDGLAIRIKGPTQKDCTNPHTYYNRKHFFSVNLQAMCDSKRRFVWDNMKCPGSAHDATAWSCSGFSLMAEKLAELGFWIAGDDAYPLSEWLITPFPGKGLPAYECNFNFYQSRLRISIGEPRVTATMLMLTLAVFAECAFGMLNRRYIVIAT